MQVFYWDLNQVPPPQYWGDRCWFGESTIPVVSEDWMVVDAGQQESASWIWFEELSPGRLKCGFYICIYRQRMTFKAV